jgi:hypothetical protein
MKHLSWRAGVLLSIVGGTGCTSSAGTVDASATADGGDAGAPQANIVAPTDGTRIKTRWMAGPEGQRAFLGYYDTMSSTTCTFRRAADGELHCLPDGFEILSPVTDFADGTCTAPAARYFTGDCNPAPFIQQTDGSDPCQSREHIYARGARIVENRVFRKSGNPPRCVPRGLRNSEVAYRLGAEVPASMFVKATDVPQPPSDAALQLVERHADDGAVSPSGWQNRATGTRCELWELDDHREHCFPATARAARNTFQEGTCRQRAVSFTSACGTPSVGLQTSIACPITYHPMSLGPATGTLYEMSGGMCTAGTAATGTEYHGLATDVPADPFPPLDAEIEQRPWRLERRVLAAPGGAVMQDDGFQDIGRKEACAPYNFGGTYRCAPADVEDFDFVFADANCTQPLHAVGSNTCALPYVLGWDVETCPPRPQFYSVHAIVRPAATYTLYSVSSESEAHLECQPTSPAPDPGTDFLALTPIPETEFAEMTVIEPK